MDNDKIESVAVRAVERIIDFHPEMKAHISEGDKFPVWDGNIVMRTTINDNNTSVAKIPLQVKGIKVNNFSGEKVKFNIRTIDLNSYSNDGGVIYFVVQIIDFDTTKVYYSSFLPVDIEDLLKGTKKSQKTVYCTLYELNEKDTNSIKMICDEFLYHRELQYSTKLHRISYDRLNELDIITSKIFTTVEDFDRRILSKQVMLYGRKKNETIMLPIGNVDVELIKSNKNGKITINEEVFYKNYCIEKTKENEFVSFGKCIKIDFKGGRIKYKIIGTLSERLKDVRFFATVLKEGYFEINGNKVNNIKPDDKSYVDNLELYLSELEDFNSLLDVLDMDEDLMMDNLSEDDYNFLNLLVIILLYNKKVKAGIFDEGFKTIKISNLRFHVVIEIDQKGFLTIIDVFNNDLNRVLCLSTGDGINTFDVSIFVLFKMEDLLKLNMSKLLILESRITEFQYSEIYGTHVNLLVLEFIKVYDHSNISIYLDISLRLCEWLLKKEVESPIFLLNKLQIIKRSRRLNKEERDLLFEMRKRCINDSKIMCGISILLGNNGLATLF